MTLKDNNTDFFKKDTNKSQLIALFVFNCITYYIFKLFFLSALILMNKNANFFRDTGENDR